MSNYSDLELMQIKKFFDNEHLDFRNFPIKEVSDRYNEQNVKYYFIDMTIIKSQKKREEFRDYLFLIFAEGKPFKATTHNIKFVFDLPEYINQAKWETVLDADDKTEPANCTKYFNNIGRHYDHITNSLIPRMKVTLYNYYDTRTGLDKDVWTRNELNIADCRDNKSGAVISLNFKRIKNVKNRELVKEWFKYLVGETETALSTMGNYLTFIYQFCDEIGDTSLLAVNRETFLEFITSKKDKWTITKYNKVIDCISHFYEYLAVEELFFEQSPVLIADKIPSKRKHYFNSVSEYVIMQIFNHLYELPEDLLLMYLINYSTGMRVSDVCQLKIDCLVKSEKCYFIKYNVQKMVKGHGIPISTALGELIEKRIKDILKLDYEETYLFYGSKNNPKLTDTYRRSMQKWCIKWGIKNEDGTPYNYVTHSYRHTIASDLINNYGVPLTIVQLVVLGHANIEMSLSYVDVPEERKKMINDSYVDKSGMKASINIMESISPSWTENNISKQVLPNGLCCYPSALGHCPNADVCLECEHFRTSKKFLPIHETQLEKLKNELVIYKANNWIHNIETTKQNIQTLERIIDSLKQ